MRTRAGPVRVHVRESIPCSLEIDTELAPTANCDADWSINFFQSRQKISALATTPVPQASVSSSTPALISPHENFSSAQLFWMKFYVSRPPEKTFRDARSAWPRFANIDIFHFGDGHNNMRHARY